MTIEQRQRARAELLSRIIFMSKMLAAAYLSLHGVVTWFAYQGGGWLAALATFVTLGFGDLYQALRLAHETGVSGETFAAIGATVLCFASWFGRPAFNRWANRMQMAMLTDVHTVIEEASDRTDKNQADDRDRGLE